MATRLPPEFRLSPTDAVRLLREEVFARIAVHDLPPTERPPFLAGLARKRGSLAAASTTRTSPRWLGPPVRRASSPTTGGTSWPRCATASRSRHPRSSWPRSSAESVAKTRILEAASG